jgi:hypothetical protein
MITDIRLLIPRFEELSKKFDEFYYLQRWSEGVPVNEEDDDSLEYNKIHSILIDSITREVGKRTFELFLNLPLDFTLSDIEDRLYSLADSHWKERNEIEMDRDRVLNICSYRRFYLDIKCYKTLQDIDQKKKELKILIEDLITLNFKASFLTDLNENNLQKNFKIHEWVCDGTEIRSINNYFLEKLIKQYFDSRNSEVKFRDKFANITIENYLWCIRSALGSAIYQFQADSREKFIEEIQIFCRHIIDRIPERGFVPSLTYELEKYVSKLIKNRTTVQILSDDSKLIDENTYLTWGREAVVQIEKDHPEIFPE